MAEMNVSINEGEAFFTHEVSATFSPTQFVLDFKSITPRIDVRNQKQHSMTIKHNVVLMDPYHMKILIDLLQNTLNDYENKFGKIEKPKAIEKFEKNHKEFAKKKDSTAQTPSYFG